MDNIEYIIQKCAERDNFYCHKFYDRYFAYAMKIAYRYITNYDEAMEVVQDSFLKIFNNLLNFSNKTGNNNLEQVLLAWMKKIVVNTTIDFMRRDKPLAPLDDINQQGLSLSSDVLSADSGLLYKELLAELGKLPPSYRAVFNLYAIDGYKHKEIAQMMGITTGGVKAMYFKARGILQKRVNTLFNNKTEDGVCLMPAMI